MGVQPSPTYDVAEAKSRFSELVQRAMHGEEVVISRDNKPVAKLVPLIDARQSRTPGSAKDQVIEIADDFDAPLGDLHDHR